MGPCVRGSSPWSIWSGVAMVAFAGVGQVAAGTPPERVRLWLDGAPAAKGDDDVDQPFVDIWRPEAGKANGAAFVICPGGGYGGLAADHEGAQVARFCNAHGITALVLHYRLGSKGYHHPTQLLDVQRAIRHARAHAEGYGLDPQRIGVIGFSAGGHLASMAATLFDERPSGGTDDAIDAVSARPDIAVLAYPVISLADVHADGGLTRHAHRGSRKNLLGPADNDEELARQLSTDGRVTDRTPPVFLFQTDEDSGVPAENAVAFYLACRRHGVPVELHVFQRGSHGVGLALGDHTLGGWSDLLAGWLRDRGFLRPSRRVAVEGRVTVDGVPVSWGNITFAPDDPFAPIATARIRNGGFKLPDSLGPVAGSVTISVRSSIDGLDNVETADGTVTITELRPGAGPWRVEMTPGQGPLVLDLVR